MKPVHLVSMVTSVQRQLKDEGTGDSQKTRITLLKPQCKLHGAGDNHEAVQRLTVRQKRQTRTEYSHTPVIGHSQHTSDTKLAVSVVPCMNFFFTSLLPSMLMQFLCYRPLFTDFDISQASSAYYQPDNLGELLKFLNCIHLQCKAYQISFREASVLQILKIHKHISYVYLYQVRYISMLMYVYITYLIHIYIYIYTYTYSYACLYIMIEIT